jgi:peptidoglycan/xylan/chitin deacetylase (PgdA/CDA1 family)
MSIEADRQGGISRRSFLRVGAGVGLGAFGLPLTLRRLISQAAGAAPANSTAVRIVSHGDRSKRQIALTVDDGWNPDRVRVIFELLQQQRVKATFMPYAHAMTWDRTLWRRIAEAGYPIGNHTTTHPFLTRLSAARQLAEIADGRSIAEGIIGRPTTRVFRPPYGDYNQSVVRAAVEAGFPTVVLWDTSDRDTSQHGTARDMLAAAEQGQNGSILLTHGGPAVTPTIMPAIVSFYRAHGFEFVTLGELLGIPGAKPTR